MKHRTYFQAQSNYVWRWEESGTVVAIPDGPTIAYRAHLTELLHQLAPQGLPPLGALLMAMSATNPNGAQTVRTLEALLARALPNLSPDGFLRHEIDEAVALLHRLAALPDGYQQGQKRLLLVQTLFEKAHNALSAPRSRACLRELAEEPAVRERVFRAAPFDTSVVYRDLKTLTVASRRFPTNEYLLEAIRNVPDLANESPDLPPAIGTESLVEALIAQPQTFYVGTLIRSLWAGLTIPAPQTQPTAMPLGGVLDLTNKGSLDRLLLTEFAQDDLLLLSRLANGEALFLNRERPPASPQNERVFLIDVSLPTWGTPRTLAFALLVALAHHPRKAVPSRAFAVGERAIPLTFDTPDALLSGLLQLSPVLHAAGGLGTFSAENSLSAQTELLFITTPDALRQPDVQRWLTTAQQRLGYLLTTEADGTITVYKQHRHRRQQLQTIRLPLARLWQRRDTPSVTAGEDTATTYLATPSYPLLFPCPGQFQGLLPVGSGQWLGFSPERGLLLHRFNEAKPHGKGWALLVEKLPVKSPYRAVTQLSGGIVVVLQLDPQKRQLFLLNLPSRQWLTVPFPDWKPHVRYSQFIAGEGLFYCVGSAGQYWTIRATDGHITQHKGLPDAAYLDAWEASLIQTTNWAGQLPRQMVLKRVNRAGIDKEGWIFVNQHRLYCDPEGHIRFMEWPLVQTSDVQIAAIPQAQRTDFRFPDGSTLRVQREGMLILQSSRPTLPAIYVPLVLECCLGVVAGDVFTGNPYFQQTKQAGQQPTQTPGLFWQTYFAPFIETILAHDAGHQTT